MNSEPLEIAKQIVEGIADHEMEASLEFWQFVQNYAKTCDRDKVIYEKAISCLVCELLEERQERRKQKSNWIYVSPEEREEFDNIETSNKRRQEIFDGWVRRMKE